MKFILTLFLCFAFLSLRAQTAEPDRIQTKKGPLVIQPIMHGSLILKWDNKTIYVDPYGGAELYAQAPAPDLILITDIHQDHLDLKTLKGINTSNALIVAPQAVINQLPANLQSKAALLHNDGVMKTMGVTISALPMYNLPETADSRHPKGRGNGYVLTIGGKRIYLSGDTEGIQEMRDLKNIDVAFVSMNLPYTMDIDQAASAVLDFKPKIIYPYHYRGQNGMSDVSAFKQNVEGKNSKIDVRLRKWYPEK